MKNSTFVYAQRVIGQERKAIAKVIAEATGEQVRYTGAPSFAYEVNGWTIEKSGLVRSPETETAEIETLRPIPDALKNAVVTSRR